ncbi:hypothetical protein [Agaribacillus aureus]
MEKSITSTINVLIIGNNPIELSRVRNQLKNLKGIKFISDFCFSTRDSLMKILKFKPGCILVDDTIDKKSLADFSSKINSNHRTKDIPITLLKSCYKKEINVPGLSDFLLKDGITGESLSKAIINVIKSRKTQRYLYIKYKKNKRKLTNSIRLSKTQAKGI